MQNLIHDVVQAIKESIRPEGEFTPLHIPIFDERDVEAVRDCIESNFVSSVGPFVDKLENALVEFTGAKRCVLCVNGTAALHLSLHMLGVEPGDEVMIPSFTFVATANAVSYCKATPHFLDIEDEHLGLDPFKLRTYLEEGFEKTGTGLKNLKTGKFVKALVPMHSFGHPCKMKELQAVSEEFGLPIVEDAAESLGSYYNGVHTGNFSTCGILSFNGNKVITTGGGGAILTNDDDFADRAKYLSTTAKIPHKWHFRHDVTGFNYRMPALNAALGCAQMDKLPSFLEKKRILATRYENAFSSMDGVRFLSERDDSTCNFWLNALVLEDESGKLLEQLLETTNESGIMTRPAWTPMHLLPMFESCPKMELNVTESMAKRVINIPSTASLV
jgi:perosamine synthetase